MTTYDISLKEIYRADELHELLAETLSFPDYYGGNLDALYDVLTTKPRGWVLHFIECEDAEVSLGKYYNKFRRVCLDAAAHNPNLEVSFGDDDAIG